MATSKSPEKWIAGALLYSGRRDPTWELEQEVANGLMRMWEAMPPSSKSEPSVSRLGYRGVFLRGPGNREWTAFCGIASLETPTGVEVRNDTGRKFEKALLASAPRGMLPDIELEQ